jgi:hypothetical protein
MTTLLTTLFFSLLIGQKQWREKKEVEISDQGTTTLDGEGGDGELSAGVKNNDAHIEGASSERRKLRYN